MWMTDDDIEQLDKENSENITQFLHGKCHEWVLSNYSIGDIIIAIVQTSYETGDDFLLHCFIRRHDKFLDIRGETVDLQAVLESFDEGDDDIFLEFDSKDAFEEFLHIMSII